MSGYSLSLSACVSVHARVCVCVCVCVCDCVCVSEREREFLFCFLKLCLLRGVVERKLRTYMCAFVHLTHAYRLKSYNQNIAATGGGIDQEKN